MTFALAALDLVLAATMSTYGWRAGVAGQAFLAAGTLATLLLVPLAITSNRWSMRRFGGDWKRLHRLVYVVLALVTLHLLLLPGCPKESGQLMVFVLSLHVGLGTVSERKPYKTDLSDEQWSLVEPVIAAWKAAHPSVSGHRGRYEMREIVNALLYQGRTGCRWELLPHDFPPPGAVKYYFYTWRDGGIDQTIHDLLRWQVREMARRKTDPSLVVLDAQSVHAAAGVPAESTGRDAAKKYRAASAAWPLTFRGW